jgi:hypothetical protein
MYDGLPVRRSGPALCDSNFCIGPQRGSAGGDGRSRATRLTAREASGLLVFLVGQRQVRRNHGCQTQKSVDHG